MNSAFWTFTEMGLTHIADLAAYDHILFIIALCAIYRISEWKRVAVLVTAFTIGHSVTLALAALDVITFPKDVIELLIPVTIILTCLYNIFSKSRKPRAGKITPEKVAYLTRQLMVNYIFAFFFGLIHGMGFSNYLRDNLLSDDNLNNLPNRPAGWAVPEEAVNSLSDSLVWKLFSFNIGLEIGQLIIVAIILAIAFFVLDVLKISQRTWTILVSSIVGVMAIQLIIGLLGE